MKTRERVMIYSLLTVLAAVNGTMLLARTGTPALAGPNPNPGSFLDELGPAESLTLLATEGDGKLVLRNQDGHLSWGDAPHQRVYSVAYVYIGAVLKQLMNSEEFKEDRDHLVSELNDADTRFREKLEEIGTRGQELDPDSDEFRQTYESYLAAREEYGTWQQQAMAQRGKLDATHLESAYRLLVDAVQIVADRKKIDTVYRFIPTDDPFNAENPEQAMQAIRLRSALRYPDELNITDDVLQELSLEVE